jgi:hypothetical protein
MNMNSVMRAAAAGALFISPLTALACASCGCSLSSDWETRGSSSAGLKMDIRYDYLDQNQLRSGTGAISPAAASQLVNGGGSQEVEKFTRNNYVTLGLNYSVNPDWGIAVSVPYIDRSHSTLGTASDGITAGPGGGQYDSQTSGIGDIKLIGRYQGFTPEHDIGVLFGLKLATGSFTQTGASTDPTQPGPAVMDRGLEPGSGTTDLILGAYAADELNSRWDYFLQGMFQAALDSRDRYKPGNSINLTLGVRYTGFSGFTPEVQLNARHVATDSGANADIYGTGGTLVYLSPGAVVPLNEKTAIYAFVQLPVYQDVHGVQLAPRYTASIGARYAF